MKKCVLRSEELENEELKMIEKMEKYDHRSEVLKDEQLKIIQKHDSNPTF